MKILFLFLVLALTNPGQVQAQEWAIDGFDAVGFMKSGRPVPGRGDIATMWKGKVWHFANEENRARFEADPRSFAPAFGGFCPVALADGRRVKGDPRHFMVIGNRLYLLGTHRAAQRMKRNPDKILSQAHDSWRP